MVAETSREVSQPRHQEDNTAQTPDRKRWSHPSSVCLQQSLRIQEHGLVVSTPRPEDGHRPANRRIYVSVALNVCISELSWKVRYFTFCIPSTWDLGRTSCRPMPTSGRAQNKWSRSAVARKTHAPPRAGRRKPGRRVHKT